MNIKTLLANLAAGYYISYLIYGDEEFGKEAAEFIKMASEAVVISFNHISWNDLTIQPN